MHFKIRRYFESVKCRDREFWRFLTCWLVPATVVVSPQLRNHTLFSHYWQPTIHAQRLAALSCRHAISMSQNIPHKEGVYALTAGLSDAIISWGGKYHTTRWLWFGDLSSIDCNKRKKISREVTAQGRAGVSCCPRFRSVWSCVFVLSNCLHFGYTLMCFGAGRSTDVYAPALHIWYSVIHNSASCCQVIVLLVVFFVSDNVFKSVLEYFLKKKLISCWASRAHPPAVSLCA